jgi:hypothetical protein
MMRYASISFLATILAIALASAVHAAPSATNSGAAGKPGASRAKADVASAEAPVPQSVFMIPAQPSEGRDPFYPRTIRLRTASNTQTNRVSAPAVADLKLNGLSGTPERPLAVINGVTFGKGDENVVPLPTGRVRVLCIEVRLRDEAAVVEVAGERKELRLRQK